MCIHMLQPTPRLFVPACAYERNPRTTEEKRTLVDAALTCVLEELVSERAP